MRWNPRDIDKSAVTRLANEAKLTPIVARLLVARGVTSAEGAAAFLNPSLGGLHSPYLMLGMDKAVERLLAAIERKEKILIYGDYDVDGTTAIVILKTVIELCGSSADFHVPHRIREGYGMKDDIIERAAAEGVRLIISVDTGIRAFAAAETAHRLGVELIVTDHHLAHEIEGVPRALAVLNPNQPGCGYPCKSICGAGVAFKLAQAILEKAGREKLLPSFLKMVAIATIADAVPLVGENRIFAKLGLEGLRSPVNAGLKALLEVSQLDGTRPLNGGDVAFRLAPRLNAAGRMDVARDVIELFSVKDLARARELAQRLDQLNAERQAEEAKISDAIEKRLDGDPSLRESFCIVVDGDGWHRGVIGICATRVVERYNRPALVIAVDGEEAHGSGRSIAAFHLLDGLESCHELFSRYGGHAHAVGFGLPAAQIPQLRAALDGYARTKLTLADFEPSMRIEAEIELRHVTPELYQAVRQLEPFGMGNPEPVFGMRGMRVVLPPKIVKDKHVKFRLATNGDAAPRAINAMGWRMAEEFQQDPLLPGDVVDVAFTVDYNDHPDFGGLELCIRDLARAKTAVTAVASD